MKPLLLNPGLVLLFVTNVETGPFDMIFTAKQILTAFIRKYHLVARVPRLRRRDPGDNTFDKRVL